MRVLKKSGQVQSYKSNQTERQYFNVLAGNGAELLHIRVYQLHRFTMVRQGLTYKFANMVKKGDACWVVGTSTIGYAPPVPVDTWPDHKLVLPEEEPATGCKRSLQDALGSPQKSTVQGKIVQVAPIVYRRDGTLAVRSLALKDKSGSPVKVTLFEDRAQADYIEDSVLEVTGVYNRTFQNKKQLAASSVTTCQYVVESPENAIIISDEDRSFFNDDTDFNPRMEAPGVTAMIEQIFDVAVYSGCSNEACRKKKMNNGICPVCNGTVSSKTVRLSVEIVTNALKQTVTIFEKDVRNIFELDLTQEEDDVVLMLVEQLPLHVKGTIARNVIVNVHKV